MFGNTWRVLTKLFNDPPPRFAFELSEAGIAFARTAKPPQVDFRPLESGALAVSPLQDNVLRPDLLAAHVRSLAPDGEARKKRDAALILPDYSARVFVLDFDAFPSQAPEQLSLLRFRVKKSVPFDADSAAIGYYVQPRPGDGKKVDVVVAVSPMEIVSRYEAPFRAAGFHPGSVTTSTMAALGLVPPGGVRVFAKRSRRILNLVVLSDSAVRLVRSVELNDMTAPEVTSYLYPTVAYTEDRLSAKPEALLMCGFGALGQEIQQLAETELGIPVQSLQSRFGTPDEQNAGLLGYLESLEEA